MCINVVQRQAAVALYALMEEIGGDLGAFWGKKGKYPNGQELMEARASLDYKLEYIGMCLCE